MPALVSEKPINTVRAYIAANTVILAWVAITKIRAPPAIKNIPLEKTSRCPLWLNLFGR